MNRNMKFNDNPQYSQNSYEDSLPEPFLADNNQARPVWNVNQQN